MFVFYLKRSDLEEEYDPWRVAAVLQEVSQALVEDDLLLPLRDGGLVLLEVERLGHDGQNMLHALLLVERRHRSIAAHVHK